MTLRDLRQKAKEFDPPISFDKSTPKEELERLIAERLTLATDPTNPIALAVIEEEEDPSEPLRPSPAAIVTDEDLSAATGDLPLGFEPPPPTPSFVRTATTQNPAMKSFDEDECLKIHENDLDGDMIAQPGIYCIMGAKYARAQAEMIRAKHALERIQATLSSEIRDRLATAKEKTTEALISSLVVQDGRYQSAVAAHIAAMEEALMWKAKLDAADQRKDMLCELTRNRRKEYDQTLSIKAA